MVWLGWGTGVGLCPGLAWPGWPGLALAWPNRERAPAPDKGSDALSRARSACQAVEQYTLGLAERRATRAALAISPYISLHLPVSPYISAARRGAARDPDPIPNPDPNPNPSPNCDPDSILNEVLRATLLSNRAAAHVMLKNWAKAYDDATAALEAEALTLTLNLNLTRALTRALALTPTLTLTLTLTLILTLTLTPNRDPNPN